MPYLSTVLTTAIDRVSWQGRIAYTDRQLYYEVCRVLRPLPIPTRRQALAATVLGLIPALLSVRRPRLAAGLVLAALSAPMARLVRHIPFTLAPPITFAQFSAALASYTEANGTPAGLCTPPAAWQPRVEPDEPDLYDYGLPRVLVCQHRELAHMLRTNMVHMDLACLVLASDEAFPLPDAVCAMLARAPGPFVFLLHDASPEGLALAAEFRERLEPLTAVRARSLGLRPIHARQLHLFAQRRSCPHDLPERWPAYLSRRECGWLRAGRRAEVFAVPPVRLLPALRASMANATRPRRERIHVRDVGFMTWPSR